MADSSDVENALVSAIFAAVYPNGTAQPSAVPGTGFKIYAGWPQAAGLDADLRAGVVNVSVYPRPSVERNTTRFGAEWKSQIQAAPKVTLAVAGNQVTVGGTIQAGDVATIKMGGRAAYSVGVQANSTLAGIASALAALVSALFPASSSGVVITISTGAAIAVAVGGLGTAWRELRRQRKSYQVIVWASTPDQRAQAAPIIDKAFAQIELSGFLTLPDGSAARLEYEMTRENDAPQKELLYRRDLFYSVEYPTTDTMPATSITAVVENVQGSGSPPDAAAVTSVQ